MAIALAIGLGNSISARAIDTLYGDVPTLIRGRVIARTEFFFHLANVLGAVLAVAAYPGPRAGFAVVAAVLILVGIAYASHLRLSFRNEAGRWLLGWRARHQSEALHQVLLTEAIRYAELGEHRVAIVMADSAVRSLDAYRQPPADSDARREWRALAEFIACVLAGSEPVSSQDSVRVIEAAEALTLE